MNVLVLKQKLKALGIHLLFSILLALICFLIVYYLWYPSPLLNGTNVVNIFFLMMAVDLIVGPLLTFIVYRRPKKTLKMDLMIIVLMQLSAMSYGMYAIYQGRPVLVAFVMDRFELVRANEIVDDPAHPYQPQNEGLNYVYVDLGQNVAKQRLQNFIIETQQGVRPAQRPEFYQNMNLAKSKIQIASQPISNLKKYNATNKVDEIMQRYPQADGFIPLTTNDVDLTVLIAQKNSQIIKIVDLRPWQQ